MSKNVCGERLINGIVKENPTFVMMFFQAEDGIRDQTM